MPTHREKKEGKKKRIRVYCDCKEKPFLHTHLIPAKDKKKEVAVTQKPPKRLCDSR